MKVEAKDIVKGVLGEALAYRYHWSHRIKAAAVLKTVESRVGKTSPRHLRLANQYARDVLGHRHYAPWLYVYAAVAGTFKEGWIPDNYYGHVVVPRVNGGYGRISHLKLLETAVLGSDAFPDLAYYANGLFLTPTHVPVRAANVKDLVFRDSDRVAFKIDNSKQGRGVFFFSQADFDIEKVLPLGNGVFQTYIRQHALFDTFSTGSVATLRITTAVDDEGSAKVRACYLRLGRSEDTHVQSKSHIRVPVDPMTGDLAPEGYLADWTRIEEHPDTRRRFGDHRIPAFPSCISTVLDLHRKVPFARCIGWDVAVTADEKVKIMEWNAEHNDIKFSEATQGPCFADLGWENLWRGRLLGQAASPGAPAEAPKSRRGDPAPVAPPTPH